MKHELLHLHGAIRMDGMDPEAVKRALRNAAGKIPGPAGARQVQLKNFDWRRGGPDGWARYPAKAVARTRRVIDHHNLTFMTDDLRELAGESWELQRINADFRH